ncbi:MAG: hypothetical protein VXW65_09800 [Pseudomonadota bacterium]|nr:hypothetical protein [Pseudomonadota bacterium]
MQVSLYGQGCFFQCIEGPAKQINHIFQQLANLPIGFDLQVLTWHDLASAQLTHSGTHYLVENLPVHTLLTRHGIAAKEAVYLHELIHIFQNHVQSPLVDPSKPTTSGAGGARQFC